MSELGTTADEYRFFATAMARGSSPLYERLALGVAGAPQMLELLDGLPVAKRQPNLLLAAARYVGGTADGYAQFRDIVFANLDAVVATMLERRTQTNEPGRCAGLYPALASLPQPLALLEVGATLVVLHTAVLDYVPEPGREAFVERMRRLDGHWLSQSCRACFRSSRVSCRPSRRAASLRTR